MRKPHRDALAVEDVLAIEYHRLLVGADRLGAHRAHRAEGDARRQLPPPPNLVDDVSAEEGGREAVSRQEVRREQRKGLHPR